MFSHITVLQLIFWEGDKLINEYKHKIVYLLT
jgi:hypothetical protein